ncbi:deoxyribodipyrimidine photo-lyase [Spongiibacter sp. KMU-158]|uniref:Deoxyribodipyrimidine photo-lyase n=1 Tax=Spongiibacter pelagi TaxID=2760804 RepID=A0A927BZS0_9GAMM|nr:deoxyribodipyrimidine photo-lyase [Spongiibacter pelagi]MBD2857543.1 deoxyribodipyrimidine photo-lyase [Spongiibacter pelagi]
MSASTDTGLVWFRHDLRVLDHPALTAATQNHSSVRAIYLLCPQQLDEHIIAPIRRQYLRLALDELSRNLAALGIPLDIVDAGHFSKVPTTLATYCQQHDIAQVYAHREFLVDEMQRDLRCSEQNIPLTLLSDALILPEQALKPDGKPYQVFTPFSKRCRQWLAQHFPQCLPKPYVKADKLILKPSVCPVFGEERDAGDWPVKESAVLDAMRQFCRERAHRYKEERDFPDLAGTSKLSPALALGLVSARQCLARLQMEAGEEIWDAKTGAGCWFNELLWREFYRHIAFHFPRIVRGHAFQTHTDQLRWQGSDTDFAAWCEGRTGFPIVDAAMRQLKQTGWMHNRLRMIVASFLCKDLHLDWRRGEAYFLSTLIDADFASNNGGWQWAASTGTDAAPYFRIFNPTSQSQRFDPNGNFIRRFLPELAHCSDKDIHAPMPQANYPAPRIDHAQAREISLSMFAELKAS